MKRSLSATLAGIFFAAACTGGGTTLPPPVPADTPTNTASSPEGDPTLFFNQGEAAFNDGRIAEAARLWVKTLRLAQGRSQFNRVEEQARASLELLASGLTLAPGTEWINTDGTQKTASSEELSTGFRPLRVQLLRGAGAGKSVVPDMPVSFEAVRGSARFTSPVLTNDIGEAESAVLGLRVEGGSATLRALIRIQDGPFAYVLGGVQLDFVYSSGKGAALTALTRVGGTLRRDVSLESQLGPALQSQGFSLVPMNPAGSLESWYNADPAVLANLAEREALGRIVIISIQTEEPRQMVLNGRAYNIYTVDSAAQVRVLATSDGTLVSSWQSPPLRGQGADGIIATTDALRRSADAAEQHIRSGGLGQNR